MTKPTTDQIDDAVDAWHESASRMSLHEWLGWTDAEYEDWLHDPKCVPDRPLHHKDQG